MGRIVKMDIISDETAGTLFEGMYADMTKLFEPNAVFRDKALVRLITKKFPEGFHDSKLEDKSVKLWLEKGLPSTKIRMEENVMRVPISAVVNTKVDQKLKDKLHKLQIRKDKRHR
jgi:hypothetical protein